MEQSQTIHIRAEFSIEQRKIEEYKKLVKEMSKMVEANELDTINYQFYLNKEETKCIVHETYANSKAALAHNDGVASRTILPKIFSLAKVSRFEVYGDPNEELEKLLKSFSAETFSLFAGFSR